MRLPSAAAQVLGLTLVVLTACAAPSPRQTSRDEREAPHKKAEDRKASPSDTPGTAARRETGKVKWFNAEKGFGFITPDSGSKDLFCHHSEILSDDAKVLQEGDRVEYERVSDEKGPKATKLRRLESRPQ